ncbi:CDP-glucose 4,6-dehydratase [Rhodobacterales bacterium HKCCE3408]|nr:CDP-glucose 4,6-dehydratase [Rhodobacterales bacterium HKCCE3408]
MGLSAAFSGRRVLVTGHTGFKGSWLSHWLLAMGAEVSGIALEPDTEPSLFEALGLRARMANTVQDIRDFEATARAVELAAPDIVFHLAAQPLVRQSYRDPVTTFATNVMGTAHVIEALRTRAQPCVLVVATTDKVYENNGAGRPFAEDDPLGGYDPYSASKAAAELVAGSYRRSYFADGPVRLATARAGNVIGGGDWAEDRILPDLARAFAAGRSLGLRNPHSTRPWQHVLDPLHGYLRLSIALADGTALSGAYNFGPDPTEIRSVGELVANATRTWPGRVDFAPDANAPHEAERLSLATERAATELDWRPVWDVATAVEKTVAWYRATAEGADPVNLVNADIAAFEEALA